MESKFDFYNVRELQMIETLEINGGGSAWVWLGKVCNAIGAYIDAAREGGYAAAKVGTPE